MDSPGGIADETLQVMLEAVNPGWTLRRSSIAEAGHNLVVHASVEAPEGSRDLVLKTRPRHENGANDVDIITEAALVSIVDAHTDLPVPTLHGLITAHTDLPAPFFVMDEAAGTQVPRRKVGTLSDDALRQLARESGRALGELHRLPVPEAFGRLVVDSERREGDAPLPFEPTELTTTGVVDESPSDDWRTVLDAWIEQALAGHANSRFSGLTPRLRAEMEQRIGNVEGPFDPVVARIDHGLHNLTCDPETGELTGIFDWGFTLATPPSYDVACVLANFTRDPWAVHPATPERDALVRRAFLDGYLETGDPVVLEHYDTNRDCYELLVLTRAMTHLEMTMADGDAEDRDAAAAAYRALVDEHC